MTAPKRRTIDPKQKAQDALGVARRRVAYLRQHPLLIEPEAS